MNTTSPSPRNYCTALDVLSGLLWKASYNVCIKVKSNFRRINRSSKLLVGTTTSFCLPKVICFYPSRVSTWLNCLCDILHFVYFKQTERFTWWAWTTLVNLASAMESLVPSQVISNHFMAFQLRKLRAVLTTRWYSLSRETCLPLERTSKILIA